jgi:ribose 5-phosphate isomerase B
MKIYFGSDHAGFELKGKLISYLKDLDLGYEMEDKGAFNFNKDDDYPDFIREVAESVASTPDGFGVIIGGSGQGEAICANRTKGARAVVFYGPKEAVEAVDISGKHSSDTFEIIRLAREHNDANILSIGVRFTTEDEAKFATEMFLSTKFSGDERHIRRIEKLDI